MRGLVVCREAVSNPDTLRQILNPQNLQAMVQMQQAMSQLQQSGVMPGGGMGSGMGGGFGGELQARGCWQGSGCCAACCMPPVRAEGSGMGCVSEACSDPGEL